MELPIGISGGGTGGQGPEWRYNPGTRVYSIFDVDGAKLFELRRDDDDNAVLATFDDQGVEVFATSAEVPDWIDLVRQGTDQSGIVTDTDLIMSKVAGTLAYNVLTGVISLKGGKLYRLSAAFVFLSISKMENVDIQWVRDSDNGPVTGVVHKTMMMPVDSTRSENSSGIIELVHRPVEDEDVKLRCTEYTHVSDDVLMARDHSMATVVEIR